MSTRTVDASPAGAPPVPPAVIAVPAPRSAAARRRSSRKSLLAAVLVVLLGGLLALLAGRMLTEHSQVLAVARDVPAGATLTAADLTVANVTSDPALSPVPAAEQSLIVGLVAQVPLVRGELLMTRAQVGTGDGLGSTEMLVALPLKEGQFPARGLAPGQPVLIVTTQGSTGVGTPAGGATGVGGGRQFAATVAEVGQTNPGTQVTVVDVRVGSTDGPAVAALGSTGDLALVLLPAGG